MTLRRANTFSQFIHARLRQQTRFAPCSHPARTMSSTLNASSTTPSSGSRLISGRYPPVGTSPIADRIRQRRGARGLTPLDANLLHFPEAAAGYNDLLGALRTGGRLPGDIREIMVRLSVLLHVALSANHVLLDSPYRSFEQCFLRMDTT